MFFIYDVLYFLGFIFYLPVLFLRGKLHGGFKQRFAFFGEELKYRLSQKPNIWFHAVSVGEVLAIVQLVEKLRLSHPDCQMVISTVTPTGYGLAMKRFKKQDIVIFAPLDIGWIVQRFIRAIRPEIFIIAETEIWPNLLTALARVDVPMVMVNGRISDRSFYQYKKFRFLFCDALKAFRAFCMQSVRDADRIIALGAVPKNVIVSGSMKFDDVSLEEKITLSSIGLKEDAMLWVAGSTHSKEEKIVVDVFQKLKQKFPLLSLVIVPRHIDRADEICGIVRASGLGAVKFSSAQSSGTDCGAVMVVDTIGHLKSFYRLATVVFVGKSLAGFGGQNIIEPAFFSKPVVVGPHMQNFAEIMDIFLDARAMIQIQEEGQLFEALSKLLESAELRNSLGQRAFLTVTKNQGAVNANEKMISGILARRCFYKPQ